MTSNWFSRDEAAISTTIGAQANVAGILMGMVFPVLMIDAYDSEATYTDDQI